MPKPIRSNRRPQLRRPIHLLHFAAAIFLGAFLLFQVQPIVSRMILPWFGGGSSVWTTCMLFFQTMLVAGYAYVHGLVRISNRRTQMLIHLSLLVLACLLLPITPGEQWQPEGSSQPALRILILLFACVGLPYFLLSTTGPLVQWWYTQTCSGASPYRLFALSNAGSLIALLSYPFAIEGLFPLAQQGFLWSSAFVIYAIVAGTLARRFSRADAATDGSNAPAKRNDGSKDVRERLIGTNEEPPSGQSNDGKANHGKEWTAWVLLSAFGSVVLLAMTNAICQNIAVMPFLWIAPLSLYLLSFIFCFEHDRWYSPRWIGLAATIAVLLIATGNLADYMTFTYPNPGVMRSLNGVFDRVSVQLILHLSATFLLCMACHGELAFRKPEPRRLTNFYLAISIGGALGGVFVGIICPVVFSHFLEFNLVMVVGFGMSSLIFFRHARQTWLASIHVSRAVSVVGALGFVVVVWSQYGQSGPNDLLKLRNFYGTIRLMENTVGSNEDQTRVKTLCHGAIIHGSQFQLEKLRTVPTTYYTPASGVGILLENYKHHKTEGLNIGVVGLGVGTVATYGDSGDAFRFFEINPQVVEVAQSHFTFLKDSLSRVEIVEGDARLTMGKQPDSELDILILDAFSGDAIPTHLLTKEAFTLYLEKLKPDGVICVHVSNRYVNLLPAVGRMAMHQKMRAFYFLTTDPANPSSDVSEWIWISKNDEFLNSQLFIQAGVEVEVRQGPLWTDQYCSIVSLMLSK